MIQKIRRILTGHNAKGRSIILADGFAANVKEMASMPGLALTDLWETRGAPASNEGGADAADRPVRLEPPPNGTILRVVEFPPDAQWRDRADAREAFKSIGAGHAADTHSSDPMMHKTATVDYAIVLKGPIHAVMEEGEVELNGGDILVQRGTNHSWSVRGPDSCLVAFVLVSAAPIGGLKNKKTLVAQKGKTKPVGKKKK